MTQVPGLDPKRRLGRGLSALLGGNTPAAEESSTKSVTELRNVSVQQLTRNPYQPRRDFDAESLGELASSVKEHGILQPILVREIDGGFQVIAGERRWQAAVRAGLATIPCRVVDVIDKTACEYALEENLKRKDLGDLEKAQAFRDYLNSFGGTIEELAKQLSMNRSTVSNFLRLLDLPEPVRLALSSGKISAGHARAILPLEVADQLAMCGRIQAEAMSVRATEAAARKLLGRTTEAEAAAAAAPQEPQASTPVPMQAAPEAAPQPDGETASPVEVQASSAPIESAAEPATEPAPETISMAEAAAEQDQQRTRHVESLEEQFRQLLGAKVEIRLKSKDAGSIVIPFSTNDEFEHIVRQLRRAAA